jgi:hypothetical protein
MYPPGSGNLARSCRPRKSPKNEDAPLSHSHFLQRVSAPRLRQAEMYSSMHIRSPRTHATFAIYSSTQEVRFVST